MDAEYTPPAIVQNVEQSPSSDLMSRAFLQQFGIAGDPVLEMRLSDIEKKENVAIADYVNSLNQSQSGAISFNAGKVLRLHVNQECSIIEVALAACGVDDVQALTKAQIASLILANQKSDPILIEGLEKLSQAINNGALSNLNQKIKADIDIALISPQALRYELKRNELVQKILSEFPAERLSDSGKKNLYELKKFSEQIGVHLEVQALSLEQERENNKAILGLTSIIPNSRDNSVQQIESLVALRNLCTRAENIGVSEDQLRKLSQIANETETATYVAYINGAKRLAERAAIQGDTKLALEKLGFALHFNQERSLVPAVVSESQLIAAQARVLAPKVFSQELSSGGIREETVAAVSQFFSTVEVDFLLAQGHLRWGEENRSRQYTDPKNYNASTDAKAFTGALEHFNKVVAHFDITQAGLDSLRDLSADERSILVPAIDALFEHALKQNATKEITHLYEILKSLGESAPASEQSVELFGLQARIMRSVFEHPQRFSGNEGSIEILRDLGVEGLSESRLRRKIAADAEQVVIKINDLFNAQIKDNASDALLRKSDYELGQAKVALSRILVAGSVSPTIPGEREYYYEKLKKLNDDIRHYERATLSELKKQSADLHERSESKVNPQEKELLAARALITDQEILARTLSLAQLSTFQAEVALAGNTPDLLRHAKLLITDLERDQAAHPAIATLIEKFREAKESAPALAALKEFLAEVNKDYPPYTLAAMIAIGILGGAAGSRFGRRGILEGFMAASCATLAIVKGYYAINGVPEVLAAWDTGLSSFNLPQSGLNVAYVAADLMQAAPVAAAIGALVTLAKSKPELQSTNEERVRSAGQVVTNAIYGVGRETWEIAKTSASLVVPNSFNAGVLYLTAIVAGTQLAQSNLPYADIKEQVTRFGYELGMTVAVAVMQARIVQALWDANEKRKSASQASSSGARIESILENE